MVSHVIGSRKLINEQRTQHEFANEDAIKRQTDEILTLSLLSFYKRETSFAREFSLFLSWFVIFSFVHINVI